MLREPSVGMPLEQISRGPAWLGSGLRREGRDRGRSYLYYFWTLLGDISIWLLVLLLLLPRVPCSPDFSSIFALSSEFLIGGVCSVRSKPGWSSLYPSYKLREVSGGRVCHQQN